MRFTDFLKDTQQIGKGVQVGIGDWQNQLEATKQAFALAFVTTLKILNGESQTVAVRNSTASAYNDIARKDGRDML